MMRITQKRLKETLNQHHIWLESKGKYGEKADLSFTDLGWMEGVKLDEVTLREANLRGADLEGADLRGVNLKGADLREAWVGYTTKPENTK